HCGTATDPSTPPYGSRWRLKASFDETPYSGSALAIGRALKRYGLSSADQGSSMFITGTTDRRWTTTIEDINQRHPIPGDAFEVVAGPAPTPGLTAFDAPVYERDRDVAQRPSEQSRRRRHPEPELRVELRGRLQGLAARAAAQGPRRP